MVRRYLDRNLTSRLGIRMLATHMLNLKDGKVRIALLLCCQVQKLQIQCTLDVEEFMLYNKVRLALVQPC